MALEGVRMTSEMVLAIGKGITESLALAAVKQGGGQHAD
jgi:hypothetical protein